MYVLNNATTADTYTSGNTLNCPDAIRLNLTVANAGIYLRFASSLDGSRGGGQRPEIFFPPGFYNRGWRVDEVAVRSAVAGRPAQVTIEAVQPADDGPG